MELSEGEIPDDAHGWEDVHDDVTDQSATEASANTTATTKRSTNAPVPKKLRRRAKLLARQAKLHERHINAGTNKAKSLNEMVLMLEKNEAHRKSGLPMLRKLTSTRYQCARCQQARPVSYFLNMIELPGAPRDSLCIICQCFYTVQAAAEMEGLDKTASAEWSSEEFKEWQGEHCTSIVTTWVARATISGIRIREKVQNSGAYNEETLPR